jgi:DNA-binding NarL/FixJ family response regulator
MRQVIAADPRFEVVAEAADGAEALRCVRELRPRLVVLDLDLPGMDGLEVARRLQAEGFQMPVVILTIHKRESVFNEALRLGVSGFVLKENAITELLGALAAAHRGEFWFSPELSKLRARREVRQATLLTVHPGLGQLTPSERRILRRIAENQTTRVIAEELGVSALTVETHRKNICRKLELQGSHRLLDFALRHRMDL